MTVSSFEPDLASVLAPPLPFRREGLGYLYEPTSCPVRFRMDYLSRRADDVTGEIVIEASLPDLAGHVHQARLNLAATNSKRDLAIYLDRINNGVPWREFIETFAASVLRAERKGEPFLKAGRLPATTPHPPLLEKLVLDGKANAIYGPGGAGKGYLATGIAVAITQGIPFAGLAVQQGPVLYLDYEDDIGELDARVKEVSAGYGLAEPAELFYRVCRSPLRNQVHEISAFIPQEHIRLVIVDSVEAAAGVAGERGTYEDAAKSFFAAIRALGPVAALLIDHVSESGRQAARAGESPKPYGSIMKWNWLRNSWFVRRDESMRGPISYLALLHTKTNRGPLHSPMGLVLDFSDAGAVKFRRQDVRESAEPSKAMHLRERLEGELSRGALSVRELSDVLGESEHTIRTTLARHPGTFGRLSNGRRTLLAKTGPTLLDPEEEVGAEESSGDEIPF